MELKLNNKRTILVGLAFLSISAFWQMYDSVMTLILAGTFQLNETVSGAIMAADNVLALFLLPLFGAISDRTETRIGRRMPFILGGTAAAAVLMNLLPMLDNQYANHPSPATLAGFVAVLALLLVAMGTYRSPAVALMPDVTPKPLRSKGNAIINLMGAVGGILYLAVAAVMYPTSRTEGMAHVDYQPCFWWCPSSWWQRWLCCFSPSGSPSWRRKTAGWRRPIRSGIWPRTTVPATRPCPPR